MDAVVTLDATSGAGVDVAPPLNKFEKNPPIAEVTLPADVTGVTGCDALSMGAADKTGAD